MEVKKNCPPLPPRPITQARAYPVLSAVEIAAVIEKNCGSFQAERYGKGRHYVFFLPEAAEELTDLKPDGQLVYFVTSDLYHLYEKYLDSFANTEAAYIGRTEGRPVLTLSLIHL